jgi:hypothetical protein
VPPDELDDRLELCDELPAADGCVPVVWPTELAEAAVTRLAGAGVGEAAAEGVTGADAASGGVAGVAAAAA